jgi:hypothetical protein
MFGSQVSAIRSPVRVIRYRCGCGIIQILNLYPNLNTRTRLPTTETRDQKSFPANLPVSGFPLSQFCPSLVNWPTCQRVN